MSIWRKLGKFFGGVLLVIFLAASITVNVLVQLLEHDNLKELTTGLLIQQFPKQELETVANAVKTECKEKESTQLTFGGNNFNINCKEIENVSAENVTAIIAGKAFDNLYFKNYGCTFVECLQRPGEEKFSVLLSANAFKFFGNIQFALWVGVAIGFVIMLVSIETWEGRLKGIGTSLIFTGLPFVLISQLQNFIVNLLPTTAVNLSPLVNKIFSSMSTNYLIIFISGVALTIAGYVVTASRKRSAGKV